MEPVEDAIVRVLPDSSGVPEEVGRRRYEEGSPDAGAKAKAREQGQPRDVLSDGEGYRRKRRCREASD